MLRHYGLVTPGNRSLRNDLGTQAIKGLEFLSLALNRRLNIPLKQEPCALDIMEDIME